MPDLEAQFSWAHDSWTLKKLVAIRPPASWSEIILAFIGRLWRPFGLGSSWDVRDALGFIAASGGKLVTVSHDQISYLRHVLLKLQESDTFLWLLRWLKNEKHCAPGIYEEVTRTASMRQKIEALNAGRYLGPSRGRWLAPAAATEVCVRGLNPVLRRVTLSALDQYPAKSAV